MSSFLHIFPLPFTKGSNLLFKLQITLANSRPMRNIDLILSANNHAIIGHLSFSLGIDSRVKMISGLIVSGLHKRIVGVTRNDRCHVVSEDGIIWSCMMPEEWRQASSSKDFVRAISVPRNLKSDLPESHFVVLKSDGTVSYGGNLKHQTLSASSFNDLQG